MKKVALLLAAVGCMTVGNYSFGQDAPQTEKKRIEKSPVEKAEKRTDRLKEELSLTDEQAEEIRKLEVYHIQEMEELRMKMKALKEEAKAKKEAHKAALDNVLTDEQKAIHDAKIAEMKEKRKECKKQCKERPE